ncbi:methyltransferase-domain-containing protein [Xylariales sp. PMI_506]|nr:methyltransferase-domain-containing protein [Xylariales sp. PMI_506]
MFAVPGWSVSADSLRAETSKGNKGSAQESVGNLADKSGSKKRKRPAGADGNVNSGNVAVLWERVIEGKSGKKTKLEPSQAPNSKESKKQKAKQRKDEDSKPRDAADEAREASAKEDGSLEGIPNEVSKKSKKKKGKSKETQPGEQGEEASAAEAKGSKQAASPAATLVAAPPKLTPLQASMREKLISARFRHLNETLYTRPSKAAFELFSESPEMFQEYHEGFRRQVNVWPENPVDGYISDIKRRGSQRPPPRDGRGKPGSALSSSSAPGGKAGVAPLLRTAGTCTIADLGCGDAKLSESLQADKKKLRLEVLSFDLQSPSPLVTRADIANLPLEDGSVNVAIFCLALMGTNWLDFIEEAYRILHWKGELWISEIKSRFAIPAGEKGKRGVVTHSVGNRKKTAAAAAAVPSKKSREQAAAAAAEANEEALAVEVDGVEDRKQETDVSAFVEALRKRGFVLQQHQQQHQGPPAIDLSNKMFVKMHFVKGAPALVGKNAIPGAAPGGREGGRPSAAGGLPPKRKGTAKFIDAEDKSKVDENAILKPCVYKIR